MKTQIILLALLFASATALTGTYCACSEITVQTECSSGCGWVSVNNESGSCQAATVSQTAPACTTLTTRSSCDKYQGCAWTNAGACASFTKCEDYSVKTEDANQCAQKDSTCMPGAVASGNVTCKAGTLSCSDITDETVCKAELEVNSTTVCWWISAKCTTQDISKCTTITDSTVCGKASCIYANNACAAPTCAGQTQENCTGLRADDQSKIQVCKWGTACADLDATTLTQANCYTGSSGTYSWNGSACTACSGTTSSNAMLLAFIGMLALLMF